MPSKGTPRVLLRMEPRLRTLILAEIERTNDRRKGRPYNFSAWVRQACIDKLKHSARSRGADAGEIAELEAFPD